LERGQPELLDSLPRDQSEFGHLTRLVEQSFSQRSALQNEIAERKKAEHTLRGTEASLRHSLELRNRLARDLHDGVIQSIYAAGLGLEGVRSALGDPGVADQRLAG